MSRPGRHLLDPPQLNGTSSVVRKVDAHRSNAVSPLRRSSVLAKISAALDSVEHGEGRAIVVTGPAGVGRSTVLEAAVQRAQDRGFRVVLARAVPRDTPVPFDLVRELLHLAELPQGASSGAGETAALPRWLIGGDGPGVVSGFPTVAILPDEDAPTEKRILRLFELERSMISLGRRVLHAQLERALLAGSQTAPVMIAVDDLHHVDRDSLDFLQNVVTGGRLGRTVLVATLDSGASVTESQNALIASLTKAPQVESVPLDGLSLDEAAGMIQRIRPESRPSPEYVQAIHRRSNGLPNVIERLTRRYPASAPSGDLPEEEGAGSGARDAWLASAPEETVRVLTYGAVIGRRFELPLLARALHRRSVEALEPIFRPLMEQGVVRGVGAQRYEFVATATRQELYANLPEERRRLIHRSVARALETGAGPAGPELYEIAYHYHQAGETGPSVDYNRRSAELAASLYAYEEARLYLERALDSLGQLPSSGSASERIVRIALGHVLGRLGKIAEAVQILDPLRTAEQSGPAGPSPLELLFVPQVRMDLWSHAETARNAAERSLRMYWVKGEVRWLAVARRALGVAAWSLADPAAAEEHHQAAADLARIAGDAQLEGQSLLDRAHLVRVLDANGWSLSRRLLTETIERFKASGNAEWLARAYLDRSTVLRDLGRLADALTDLTAASEQAAQSGSRALEIWVEVRTARVLVEERRTGRARKSLERLRQLAGEAPRREVLQQIAFITGLLQEREGRPDKARTFFEKSLALALEAETPEEAADSHLRLAELDEKAGQTEDAQRHREEAQRLAATAPTTLPRRGTP